MRNLFSLLLVATLVPASAAALAAQQPQNPTTEHAHHTMTHHTRKHHKATSTTARHHETMSTSRHHARTTSMRMRHERRTVATTTMSRNYTPPTVLGTPVNLPGIAAGRASMYSSSPSANNPAGVSRGGRLQRLSNGLITPDAARTIALRTIPGGTSVDKIRLRTDDGRRVYDVKVVTPNQTGNEMVRVDAHTGAVVETKNVDNPVGTVKGAVNKAVNKIKHP